MRLLGTRDSPRKCREVKCPISILAVEIDHFSPPELIKQFEQVLSANSGVAHFVKIITVSLPVPATDVTPNGHLFCSVLNLRNQFSSLPHRQSASLRPSSACSPSPRRTMCSLASSAPRGLDATAFLDRRRGVVAAVAPAACGVMARDPVRRVGAVVSSAAPTKKRARDGFDGNIGERDLGLAAGKVSVSVIPAQRQQRLQERMRAELDAIRVLHRKAVALSVAKDEARFSVAGSRSEAPMEEAAPKRRKTSLLKQSTTKPVKQQRATPAPTKGSVAKPVDDKAREIRRRLDEIAQARERCRQEVLEIERTALPDETIYPRELGIAFQYAFTRTWKQAHGPAI
ncbi:hypothetical protein HU200_008204 [Digitaria exilis]|uniref:Uncharacterized protein n=1 Tax=Digitaria exilis TaxID=1010633 RepID=A0A835KQG0_9POAL|nr:hypothetical protein HU200_008204 [Digitaria exilis]